MTEREKMYTGVSRVAWGYFFLYFDINLGTVSILPNFIGMLLFLSAIDLLKEERQDLLLLRPFGIVLALWNGIDWCFSWFGSSLDGRFAMISLLIRIISLYFHFQMFTDFAALAEKYQGPEDALDDRLLRWRTVQTVLLTVLAVMSYPVQSNEEWWSCFATGLVIIAMVACLRLMSALFALRSVFKEPELENTQL